MDATPEFTLLPAPVAPRLRDLASEFGAMVETGGRFSEHTLPDMHAELLGLAEDARLKEALAGTDERVSRWLFAVVGAFEKHLGGPLIVAGEEARILRDAFDLWAQEMGAWEGAL